MTQAVAGPTARASFSIPSLDGIRACSFALVFLSHVGVQQIPGGFGVTVFFFLSGYLITTLLRREAEATGRVSLKFFYLRRVFRILPPFYLILSFALALTLLGVMRAPFTWAALAAQVFHYTNYFVIKHGWVGVLAGTGVYWSLAVEEHFYLVFPALYALMLKRSLPAKTQHAVLLALCVVVLCWRCWLVFGEGNVGDRISISSDARFDAMLFGCALAVWGNPILDFKPTERPSRFESLAAATGAALLLSSFLIRAPEFRQTIRYTMQGLGLYPLFFFAIRHPRSTVGRFLNLRPIRFVGTLSYSLYLVHNIITYAASQHLRQLPVSVQAVLSLGVSLLLALGIWRFVEKPSAKLRARFSATAA